MDEDEKDLRKTVLPNHQILYQASLQPDTNAIRGTLREILYWSSDCQVTGTESLMTLAKLTILGDF